MMRVVSLLVGKSNSSRAHHSYGGGERTARGVPIPLQLPLTWRVDSRLLAQRNEPRNTSHGRSPRARRRRGMTCSIIFGSESGFLHSVGIGGAEVTRLTWPPEKPASPGTLEPRYLGSYNF